MQSTLIICCYHAVTDRPPSIGDFCFLDASIFRQQIRYLKTNYRVMGLSEAVQALYEGDIEEPLAVVTFDDGFQCHFDVVFPILQQEQCPAAFFPVSGFIGTDDTPWFCRLIHAIETTEREVIHYADTRFELSDAQSRVLSSGQLQRLLKGLPQERLNSELAGILDSLGVDPFEGIQEDSPYRMLSAEAVSTMAASDLVEFGAHTRSHAILSLLSHDERHTEIEGSLIDLMQWTGHPIELFAYPNGRSKDYDGDVVSLLRQCGIKVAVNVVAGLNTRTTPVHELQRVCIGPDPDMQRFIDRLLPPMVESKCG